MNASLWLRVIPNAKRNEVVGVHGDAIKIKIQAPAMDGKANAAVLAFIAEKLGISARKIALRAGEKSRDKTVVIAGMDADEMRRSTRILETAPSRISEICAHPRFKIRSFHRASSVPRVTPSWACACRVRQSSAPFCPPLRSSR